MAEFAVSFVAARLAEVLDQIKVYTGVYKEVDWLRDELKRMQCFLKDADEKQEDDERVKNWISDIRNLAYDADDLIDMFFIRVELHKRRGFFIRKVSSFKEWNHRCKVKRELKAIKCRIRDISASREAYGIRNFGVGPSRSSERLWKLRRSTPRGEDRDIIGLNEETTKIVSQLVRRQDQGLIWRAVSVVGMGGIGKTTLAKKVYNHADVRGSFNCCAWVYVSQNFRSRDILQGILKQVTSTTESLENLSEEELEDILYTYLLSKRYLVVLDDLWSTEAWDCLAKAFPNRSNGSRLMITTRNKNVALHIDPRTVPHEVQCLNKEDSWELFCRKALLDYYINTSCPPELEDIGRTIVGKCGGLPLAIIVLGGVLSRKKNRDEWERVLSNVHMHFARNQNGVAAILALSYKDLPQYLKCCFLYMGLFPEDHSISTRKLIRLWVAEGLIQEHHGEWMEDVAEDYLNELIDRNMVQVAKMNLTERVKECRLHDLLRDLSISKAEEDNFFKILSNPSCSPSGRSRRHAVYSNFDWYASLKHSTKHLRSLFFFKLDEENRRLQQLNFVCTSFKLLRVLDLEDVKMHYMPNEIGEVFHLKYLGLRRTNLEYLPPTIGQLLCLQTLDLASNFSLKMVPNVIRNMVKLRHLYMYGGVASDRLRVDSQYHLQTLSDIHVDNWVQNIPIKFRSLRKLGIRGSFAPHVSQIFHSFSQLRLLRTLYFRTDDLEFPYPTGLSGLRCLTKLHMRGGITNLPDPHELPPNLCQLTLHHSRLDQSLIDILAKAPKLLILRLKAYSYSESQMSISSNGFPQLKILELDFLEFLEELKLEERALPRLQRLRILSCRGMQMLPKEIKFVNTLQELETKDMRSSFISRLHGEDFYKVQHIPTVTLN